MTARMVIGSAAVLLSQSPYRVYFSLLQAIAASAAMPTIGTATATIGRQGRTAAMPIISTSTAAVSICTTTTVRLACRFVASR